MRYADSMCKYTEVFENGEQFYVFTGPCVITGKTVSVKIPGPELYAYRQGALIQNAMPSLSADDREFLMSGMSGEAFDAMFSDENMFTDANDND